MDPGRKITPQGVVQVIKERKKNQLIKELYLFLDCSLIRCDGRLTNANLTEESEYPTLLPRNKFTTLVIERAHEKVFHFGSKVYSGRKSAVQAVDRFIGRIGTPHIILSDNALQFKKGASILEAIWGKKPSEEIQESLTTFYSRKGIHWRYIPEKSPWVGGFYERVVDLVKSAKGKLFGKWLLLIRDCRLWLLMLKKPLTPDHF
ncbi:hypothetical protein HOLleu_42725 [Holothuria leucospilota]|uniref:Integrase catalytic domain-containing protein n=1 Tax=Holothuria leucospilota TaxID=206669 RepID=A0A9Q0YCP1_HOLLE|nr:hypothetical protein HOLleu_42725 [Holothuria leucospilota]